MRNSGLACLKTFGFLLLASAVLFTGCKLGTDTVEIKDVDTPVITAQPEGGTVKTGSTHTMTVTATGGALSYQWYSYLTPYQYENHLGDLIAGATDASYQPPNFTVEGTNNFYVIVTNTNSQATGRRELSVRSNPAIIGVNDPNNAVFPIIKQQPENIGDVVFRRNMELPVLTIEAEAEDGGQISYQWFVATELTNESGEEIVGATDSEFRPVPTAPGSYYYFVRVTNTNFDVQGRRQSFSLSNPAYVQVIANPNAEVPIISAQPIGAIYFSGDTVKPITVSAESDDNGVLSYQWQSSATADGTFANVTTGTGATTASFTPALSTTTLSKNYYRVVINNFAEHAQDNKNAVANSRVAEVVVTTPSTITANLTIGIGDLTGTYTDAEGRAASAKNQFVRGFGGMDVAWENFPNITMAEFEKMYDPEQLGYNLLRIMILPYNVDPVVMLSDFTKTAAGANYYSGVRYVNSQGGYVLASPWSPPAEWKSNNSIVGSNAHLRPIFYLQYANYLRQYAQAMANNGAPIYTVSIQNEPNHDANYDGANWTSVQMRDFFKEVGYFTKAGATGSAGRNWPTDIPGFGGGKALPYVLTMSGSSANTPAIHNDALNDPDAKKNISLVARHPYGSRNINIAGQAPGGDNNYNSIYDNDPREVWMTEFNLNTPANYSLDSTWSYVWSFLNSVDITIRNNHENGYIWWSAKRFYSMLGDGDSGTAPGQILPRGWGLAHFAKFAKETYHVGITAEGNILDAGGNTVAIAFEQNDGGNLNPRNYQSLGSGQHQGTYSPASEAAKIMAFVKLKDKNYSTGRPAPDPFPVNLAAWSGNAADIEYISFVMFTPTSSTGANGYDLNNVKLQLPAGFKIRGAEAMRSKEPPASSPRDVVPVWESVEISVDRNAAFVNLPRSQILSVRLFNE